MHKYSFILCEIQLRGYQIFKIATKCPASLYSMFGVITVVLHLSFRLLVHRSRVRAPSLRESGARSPASALSGAADLAV